MSHVDPDIFSSVLADIDAEYGNIMKTTITRGKIYKYLRIIIDYSSPGKEILYVVEYIGNMIDEILEDMKGESATPFAHQLFDISVFATKLYRTDTDFFHHFGKPLMSHCRLPIQEKFIKYTKI